MKLTAHLGFVLALAGCVTVSQLIAGADISDKSCSIRVGSYNISYETDSSSNSRVGRKDDVVQLVRGMNLDVLGMQEVSSVQAKLLNEALSEYDSVCGCFGKNENNYVTSPVFYRKDRFDVVKSDTFALSDYPDAKVDKSCRPNICSWAWLKDKRSGRTICFANMRLDYDSEKARKDGMSVVIRRMREFALPEMPLIFTCDLDCLEWEEPARMIEENLNNALDASETTPVGPWRTINFGKWRDVEIPASYALTLDEEKRNAGWSRASDNAENPSAIPSFFDLCGGARTDYIFVSRGMKVKDFETRGDSGSEHHCYPSCHFPILATLEFKTERPARKIYLDEFRDRVAGAWLGQSVGVSYGAPTEFKASGRILTDKELPTWKDGDVNGTFGQDDLYVEMSFMKTLEEKGIDVSCREAGIDFANTRFRLWCANANGRNNLRKGIPAPLSSHPKYHKSPNDIDYQIEADFSGIISPGCPDRVIRLGEQFGRIMNYGDGLYAGQFIGGMYAEAFFNTNREQIVEAGLKCIPPRSMYAMMVRDMLQWYREDRDNWGRAWTNAVAKYQLQQYAYGRLGNSTWAAIDVKINGAMSLLGYLFGEGDMDRTMRISTAGGYDSDCNPSSACGILGAAIGFAKLDAKYKAQLDMNRKWDFTAYDWNGLMKASEGLARKIVIAEGGTIDTDEKGEFFLIPDRDPSPSKFVSAIAYEKVSDEKMSDAENARIKYKPTGFGGASVAKDTEGQ